MTLGYSATTSPPSALSFFCGSFSPDGVRGVRACVRGWAAVAAVRRPACADTGGAPLTCQINHQLAFCMQAWMERSAWVKPAAKVCVHAHVCAEVKINRQLEKRNGAQGSPSVAVTRRVPVTHAHTRTRTGLLHPAHARKQHKHSRADPDCSVF